MKAMPLHLCAFAPLSHIFGTIKPLFSSAVWSCFMLVHPHWLPFCSVQPAVMRLCVTDNERHKIMTSGPFTMPVIQFNSNTSFLHTNPLSPAIMYHFPAVSWVHCQPGGLLFTLTDAELSRLVLRCTASQKRDHRTVKLWKEARIKRTRAQCEHSMRQITETKRSSGQAPACVCIFVYFFTHLSTCVCVKQLCLKTNFLSFGEKKKNTSVLLYQHTNKCFLNIVANMSLKWCEL